MPVAIVHKEIYSTAAAWHTYFNIIGILMRYAPINVSPLPCPSGLYGGFDTPDVCGANGVCQIPICDCPCKTSLVRTKIEIDF